MAPAFGRGSTVSGNRVTAASALDLASVHARVRLDSV